MKKILLIIGIIIVLTSVPVGVFLVKREQELRLRAAPATTLFLSPDTRSWNVGEIFNVNVNVNTGGNQITSVDLVLNFDPAILEVINIIPGTFLPSPTEIQKNINNATGSITYSFYTTRENAKSGEGVLAVISLKGKAAGISALTFSPQTVISALQEDQNVLTGATGGTYTISGGVSPTPTPTPTGGLTPTPTSALTPTSTPTSGLTPIPTPTPTSALTPIPTPTPTTFSGQGGGTIPTSTPTLTPTPTPALPVTGVSNPLVFLLGAGGIFLLFAFFLAM